MNNSSNKNQFVICVGFHKTGTSSIGTALSILNYRVKGVSSRPLIPILNGNYRKVLKMLKNYDAVQDAPWFKIYKELDELIPNSKFILTIRDEESWYSSAIKQIGVIRTAQNEWIYGRGNGLLKYNKKNAIGVYKKHNYDVKNYFKDRPNDLLILDLNNGDGWGKLCPFLNESIPNEIFPHQNKSNSVSKIKSKNKMMRRKLKSYFKIKYIDTFVGWN